MTEPASPAHSAGNQSAGNQPAGNQAAGNSARQWLLAGGLFAAVFFTATTMGVDWVLAARTDVVSPIPQVPYAGAVLTPRVVRMVWSDPALLRVGLTFSLPALLILVAPICAHSELRREPPQHLRITVKHGYGCAHARRDERRVGAGHSSSQNHDVGGRNTGHAAKQHATAAVFLLQTTRSHVRRHAARDFGHGHEQWVCSLHARDRLVSNGNDT